MLHDVSPDATTVIPASRRRRRDLKAGDTNGRIHALVEMCEADGAGIADLSFAANQINLLFRDRAVVLDLDVKRSLLLRLIDLFESRTQEATATDLSRLAWLKLSINDQDGAKLTIKRGLELDAGNWHLRNLAQRLNVDTDLG